MSKQIHRDFQETTIQPSSQDGSGFKKTVLGSKMGNIPKMTVTVPPVTQLKAI